jgi:hypothetical protein
MKYCYLHTQDSLQDEEGDDCPLCRSMNEKEDIISRWAINRKELQAEITALKERINEYEGIKDQAKWQSAQDAQALYERDDEITALKSRLAEARLLLEGFVSAADDGESHEAWERAKAFLAHTSGEYVAVRREDLELALKWSTTADNHMNKSPWHNRLKAALEREGKP